MPAGYDHCRDALKDLHDCKRAMGLQPQQCYPRATYHGECDAAEFAFKKCLAYSANSRDAKLLYESTSAPRSDRVAANQRLQAKLKQFNKPCTP